MTGPDTPAFATDAPGSTTPSAVATILPPDAPDWSGIHEEVHCPLCDYNLRGLVEPRCPECGYRFEWPNLIDPSRRLHRYLFEHHPERNVWSFLRTAIGTLRPGRFWRGIHPAQPRNVRRLLLYHAIGLLVLCVSFAGVIAATCVWQAQRIAADRQMTLAFINSKQGATWKASLIKEYGSIEKYLERSHPTNVSLLLRGSFSYTTGCVGLALPLITFPWLTFLSLQLFPITMRRARIRVSHVLRCVVYCIDAAYWGALLIWIPSPAITSAIIRSGKFRRIDAALLLTFALLLVVWTRNLMLAYRHYLRFPHAVATVIAAQLVTLFASINLMLLVNRAF